MRTLLPCTGVGRHINSVVLELNQQKDVNTRLLFSRHWLSGENRLSDRCPLSNFDYDTFPMSESVAERLWKISGFPGADRYLPRRVDWLYAPMETYLPVSKCPTAITIHDIQAFETKLPWSNTWQHHWFRMKWSRWIQRTLRDSRIVFTVSEFSKQRMVKLLNAEPQKVVVVGNGVDASFFEMQSIDPNHLPSPVTSPYTLVIGGLRHKKGADDVLAVARLLQKQKRDMNIVVAGDSEAQYVEQATEYRNVSLLGMVPDDQLPYLVRKASSLLFLSPYEGFGIPALEAMAAGVPAVVANRASLPEIVADAGIVVEPDQHHHIIEVLLALENDTSWREKYIIRGIQHSEKFTWKCCSERVLQALKTYA